MVVGELTVVPTRLAERRDVGQKEHLLVAGQSLRQHVPCMLGCLIPQCIQSQPPLIAVDASQFRNQVIIVENDIARGVVAHPGVAPAVVPNQGDAIR